MSGFRKHLSEWAKYLEEKTAIDFRIISLMESKGLSRIFLKVVFVFIYFWWKKFMSYFLERKINMGKVC